MINLYSLSEVHVLVFSLILIRMVAFIVSAPVFGGPQINAPTKVLLSLVLTLCLFPVIPIDLNVYDGLTNEIIVLAGREAIVGLCLGFVCRFFFFAVSMTGEMASVALGLNAAQLYNPLIGTTGNIIEQFYSILGMLFFFMVNGHHTFIGGLAQSFEFVKIGQMGFDVTPLGEVAAIGQTILEITIKLCSPILVAILLSQVSMGILGRAIPQINVLITSFPVTIMLGLGVMFICLPMYLNGLDSLMELIATRMLQVMKAI